MNRVLSQLMDNFTPQMNPPVINGYTKDTFKGIPDYLDSIFRSSIRSLNPNIPLEYLGWRRCTPEEEYSKMVISEGTRTNYDLASSDIYLIELMFKFNGVEMPKYLYLPYTHDGNIMTISGSKYHIVPVLSDTVISPSHKEVFVRLLKDKLTFYSKHRNFIKDGAKVLGHVVNVNIIKNISGKENTDKLLTSLSVYILGKYGFKKAVEKYANRKDVIVTTDEVDAKIRKDYHVYESTGIKPKELKDYGYLAHKLKILVPKSTEPSRFLENFIFGMLYTLDALPNMANDCDKSINSNDIKGEKLLWKLILGKVSYRNTQSTETMIANIVEHYGLLEGYLDNLIQDKLAESGIKLDNFYSLLAYLLGEYNILLINSKEYNSKLANRYIDINYYILHDIIIGFNKVILAVNKRATKKADLSIKEIRKALDSELSPKMIFKLVKNSAVCLAVMLLDSSNDIKYPKITSVLED